MTVVIPGILRIRSRYGQGQGLDERGAVDDHQSRSLPATSTPWLKAPRMATRRPKRKRATANEPKVSKVRIFLRPRLASEQGQELHCDASPSDEGALLEVQGDLRALGRARVVGHHQDRLLVLAHEHVEELQDLAGALAVEVAGRLVAEQEGGVGHDGAGDGHALELAARELRAGSGSHPVAAGPRP